MNRLAALLVVVVPLAVAEARPAAAPQDQPQGGRIRVAVDVVPVDVQVLDKEGRPIPDLGPDKFTVTINGRRRKVVSAEQVGRDVAESRSAGGASGASAPAPSRVIMIAVDCISFDSTATRHVIDSIGDFIRKLNPDDYVGLSAYPNGSQIVPTTDHAAVLRALGTVVGQRDGPGLSQFHLRPTEVIDITRDLSLGGGPTLDAVSGRECGDDPSAFCEYQLRAEVTNIALYFEGQATASLGMLRTLVRQMRTYEGRKTLVLVSGGMIASDTPGGRPDLAGLGVQVGREAAMANTAIYTLFVDTTMQDRYAAETRTADRTATNRGRDSMVLSSWLEQFSGTAGGALFDIKVSNAASALDRIQRELTSYYLLGVEPSDEDRDGRTHEVSVKTSQPGATIRGRRWVTIPKSGASASPPPPPVAAGPAEAAPAPPPEPVRSVAPEVQELADVFDRSDARAFQQALAQNRALASTIRSFRTSDTPWPTDPRRTAIFALELGLAGLRNQASATRDEGGRLLAEYHTRVRQPGGADAFECWWYLTEAAALEGLFMPENALLFIPRAVQRCPGSGRLHLAHAFVLEQQWLRGNTVDGQTAEVASHYEEAMKFEDTAFEARVRAARFRYATGDLARARTLLDGLGPPPADPEIAYVADLVRGQVLAAQGETEAAAAAFRAALAAWPEAQSARVALMTLLLRSGDRQGAAALAEQAQTAPSDQYDPWWAYWLGDFRFYPQINDRLRELGLS
jgi:VWFA-related protein